MKTRISVILVLLAIIVSYQNCTGGSNASFTTAATSTGNGNGDFYSGIKYFEYSNPASLCSVTAANGRPIPNSQIFFDAGQYRLVRENCQDIAPVVLTAGSFQIRGNDVVYLSRTYAPTPNISALANIPLVCPVGRSLSGTAPVNLVRDGMDLSTNQWAAHQITRVLGGSLLGLPLTDIVRNSNSLVDWMRASQSIPISGTTNYVFNMAVRPGNRNQLGFYYFNETEEFAMVLDLTNGNSFAHPTFTQNVAGVSVRSQTHGSGYLFSVFFTTGATVRPQGPDMGISPYSPTGNQIGDSVSATAMSLYAVDSFCNP